MKTEIIIIITIAAIVILFWIKSFLKSVTDVEIEEPEVCRECDGTGWQTEGEYDDIRNVRCWKCNPKRSIEDEMDDDS